MRAFLLAAALLAVGGCSAPAVPPAGTLPGVNEFAALSEPNMRPVVDELVRRGCLVEVVENQFEPGRDAVLDGSPCRGAIAGTDMVEVAQLATTTLNRGRSLEFMEGHGLD